MAKLRWVDTSFDKEFYKYRFANKSGQVLGKMALLDLLLLTRELDLTTCELRRKLGELGYVETGKRLEDLSASIYKESLYRFRPEAYKYPGLVDCSSFVKGVYSEFAIDLPRYSVQQIEVGKEIETPETGDLLFFDERIHNRW
jgi:hypothetical protein